MAPKKKTHKIQIKFKNDHLSRGQPTFFFSSNYHSYFYDLTKEMKYYSDSTLFENHFDNIEDPIFTVIESLAYQKLAKLQK